MEISTCSVLKTIHSNPENGKQIFILQCINIFQNVDILKGVYIMFLIH